MTKPVIAIDIDDVIADSTELVRRLTNQVTGASLTTEHFRVPAAYSRYYEHVWSSNNLDMSFDKLDSNMKLDQSHMVLLKDAEKAISLLTKQASLFALTSRPLDWEPATTAWLNTHFPNDFKQMIFTEDLKWQGQTKGEICKILGVEWLIDDRIDFCQSAIKLGVGAILFGEYGWHHEDVTDDLIRCKSWQEVLEYFNAES
mgnify:CR=1 FL=1